MKAYTQSRQVPGHGPRIYIKRGQAVPAIRDQMDKLCIGGGYDKDTGKCYSWEFPSAEENDGRYKKAQNYLKQYGFVLEEYAARNAKEVWK
jgi:hypothetical protein